MPLYNFLAPAYGFAFESIFRPFRVRALEVLPDLTGATVLDLACGTGQNFPLLVERIGSQGKIIGVDISSGMLKNARQRVERNNLSNVALIHLDAARLKEKSLKDQSADDKSADFILCTYGFTSMRDWERAFHASWSLLKPGGGYLIHDVDSGRQNLHTRAVEMFTRSHFSEKVWQPLQKECLHFRMDYIEPSAHLFGGRLFVAYGTKPLSHVPPDQQRRQAARPLQPG